MNVVVPILVVIGIVALVVAGRRRYRDYEQDKKELLQQLHGKSVKLALEHGRASWDHAGRLDASTIDEGHVVLREGGKDRFVPLGQIRYVVVGRKQWGPF